MTPDEQIRRLREALALARADLEGHAYRVARDALRDTEPEPGPIALGDVIQITPDHRALPGALAFVTEIRSWGLIAEVHYPGRGVAPVRLGPDEYERIGHAAWEPVSATDPEAEQP